MANKYPHICHEPGCMDFDTFEVDLRLWYCAEHAPDMISEEHDEEDWLVQDRQNLTIDDVEYEIGGEG